MHDFLATFSQAYFDWLWIAITVGGIFIGLHSGRHAAIKNISLWPFVAGWITFSVACGAAAWLGR